MEPSAIQKIPDPTPAALGPAVKVTNLGVSYPTAAGRRVVLSAIEFALAPGECLALVGPSGCGKSTLLHVLAGLLPPISGEVVVAGQLVAAPDRVGPCDHAAYMFQDDLLLPWRNVLENAILPALLARPGGSRRRARATLEGQAQKLLEEFGLGERLDAMPDELSGGMRQRVALARTLVLGRSLMLLDEPFGSLDALTRADLQKWLAQVMDDHPATWVLVTHDVTEAVFLADRVAVLGGCPAEVVGWVESSVARERRAAPADTEADWAMRQSVLQVQRLLETGRDR